jgi:serine/threonine protein kinase
MQSSQSDILQETDYSIDRNNMLGKGNYGTVYCGFFNNGSDKTKVAVKAFTDYYYEKDNIQQERKVLNKINSELTTQVNPVISECLVKYYGCRTAEFNSFHFVFEQANFGSLGDWIHPQKNKRLPFTWNKAYPLTLHIIKALDFLHEKVKYVHCDVKPDNVLLKYINGNLQAKLCDFGLAQPMNYAFDEGGSPSFQAPEILLYGREQTPASDMYSFGCLLFEMAARKEMYVDTGIAEIYQLQRHLKRKGRDNFPQEAIHQTPKICRLFSWTTKQNPDKRPSNKQVIEELSSGINEISPELSQHLIKVYTF